MHALASPWPIAEYCHLLGRPSTKPAGRINDPQNRGVTTEVNYDMGTFWDLAVETQ